MCMGHYEIKPCHIYEKFIEKNVSVLAACYEMDSFIYMKFFNLM